MGCCQAMNARDKEKDEPLLLEHLNSKDNTVESPAPVTVVAETASASPSPPRTPDTKQETRDEVSVTHANPTDEPEAANAAESMTASDPLGAVESVESTKPTDTAETRAVTQPQPKTKRKKRDSLIDVA